MFIGGENHFFECTYTSMKSLKHLFHTNLQLAISLQALKGAASVLFFANMYGNGLRQMRVTVKGRRVQGRGIRVRGGGIVGRTQVSDEIGATVIDHIINHGLSLREAGQRVQPVLNRNTVASIVRIFRQENR